MEFGVQTLVTHGGERLYTAHYPARGRGTVLWVHGYAEHSGRYQAIITYLAQQGWSHIAWDLRGHGRSTGRRGYVTALEEYLLDLTAVWTHYKSKVSPPVVLAGHSLGGLIALRYLQQYGNLLRPAAVVISAPLIALKVEVPAWKRAMAGVAARFFPTLSLPSGLRPEDLTHDPVEARAYAEDPHVFKTATAGWFAAIQQGQIALWRAIPALAPYRFLFLLPEQDPVCDASVTKRFFGEIPTDSKKLISYPDGYHEPMHETFREKVYADLADYLKSL